MDKTPQVHMECARCGKPYPGGAVTVPDNAELICFACAHPAEWDEGEFV